MEYEWDGIVCTKYIFWLVDIMAFDLTIFHEMMMMMADGSLRYMFLEFLIFIHLSTFSFCAYLYILQRLGSLEGDVVPYTMGLPVTNNIPALGGQPFISPWSSLSNFSKQDAIVSETLIHYLTNFVRTGWVFLMKKKIILPFISFIPMMMMMMEWHIACIAYRYILSVSQSLSIERTMDLAFLPWLSLPWHSFRSLPSFLVSQDNPFPIFQNGEPSSFFLYGVKQP